MPNFDFKCATVTDTKPICADCKTSITCLDKLAYISKYCKTATTCQDVTNLGGVCYLTALDAATTPADSCKCTEANPELKKDPRNQYGFVLCTTTDADPKVFKCSPPEEYDVTDKVCKNPNDLTTPPCVEAGTFPITPTCTDYYVCVQSQGNLVQQKYTCPAGQHFDELTGACSLKSSWTTSTTFTCTAEGLFPSPDDCDDYYICVATNVAKDTFEFYKTTCPEGTIFDSVVTVAIHDVFEIMFANFLPARRKSYGNDGWWFSTDQFVEGHGASLLS